VDVQPAKLSLHRDERAFQFHRKHYCAFGWILLFQKRNFLLRVRSLLIWSLHDFIALPILVRLRRDLAYRRVLLRRNGFSYRFCPTQRWAGLNSRYQLSTYLPQKRLNTRMLIFIIIYR
jgi:hypothetical protein